MTLEFDQSQIDFSTNIKAIGVGGGGGNAINTMINRGIEGLEFIAANTAVGELHKSLAKTKLQLGQKITAGKGAGADINIGKQAAQESQEEINSTIKGADMLLISAGFGGGTGTGAAPVIAELAKEQGILTLAIVTKPLKAENNDRLQNFEKGLANLRNHVDSYIVVPNDKVIEIDDGTCIFNVFEKANNIIYDAAKAISDIINKSGYIDVDFADVRTVIKDMGYALVGTSICEGEDRASRVVQEAISNPLLNNIGLAGCKTLLTNITVAEDAKYTEYENIVNQLSSETGPDTKTIVGLVRDDSMKGKIRLTIFASGITDERASKIGNPPLIHIKNKEKNNPNINDILQGSKTGAGDVKGKNQYSETSSTSREQKGVPSFMKKFKN